jgi:YidC/Oxa1 family membrane protein insertase
MISDIFHTTVYTPLYNALIGLLDIGPWVDMGIAVIVLTLIVKTAMFPLSLKAARTQRLMKELEEPMKEIKEKYKDNREEQGRKILELYKEKNVNPFSTFLVLFIQLPIIFGLFFVFSKGGLPEVDGNLLYNFVKEPENISMMFLGFVDMAGKNYFLAFLAGFTQQIQVRFSLPPTKTRAENSTFQEDFARSMQVQMKYILPFIVMFVAYIASAAVALYWITSNIFAIVQEVQVKRKLEKEKSVIKEDEV